MLTHQDDADPVLAETLQIGGGPDARFADDDARVVQQLDHPEGVREIGLHRVEVPVVDSQQGIARVRKPDVTPDPQDAVHIVGLDQGGHAQTLGQDHEIEHLAFVQDVGDQQDGVGARRPRLPDLVLVDDEVLPEDRESIASLIRWM